MVQFFFARARTCAARVLPLCRPFVDCTLRDSYTHVVTLRVGTLVYVSFCFTTPCAKYGFMPILFILAPCVIQRREGPAHATIAQLRLYLPYVWPSVNNVVLLRLQGASYSRWHRVKYEVQSIATVATDRSKVSRHGSAPIGGCRRLKANACGHTLAL